jgi:hypothetical protein
MHQAKAQLVSLLETVVRDCEGGVYKRIDENRELLALIEKEAPAFMETHPWIVGWMQGHENFLAALASEVSPETCWFQPEDGLRVKGHLFPRPSRLEEAGTNCRKPMLVEPNAHAARDVRQVLAEAGLIKKDGQ